MFLLRSALSSPLTRSPVFSSCLSFLRPFSSQIHERVLKTRNIGISAHIDSGKTTLTERILFYAGRIKEIHEVKGKDGVGAKMDHMELERERGITIQSAATYVSWKDHHINIIDTPGHVDFTIEVERSLRVLDGAVLVVCAVGGIQSQTYTVDRQMRRYNVPRLTFINKLDRPGADHLKIVENIRSKLNIAAAAIQVPVGVGEHHRGVVDLVRRKALFFAGGKGTDVVEDNVPPELEGEIERKREELINTLADVDDIIAEKVLEEVTPTEEEIEAAIRRATLSLKFTPVLMGSAVKNKGVQPLLDAVLKYLPNPSEIKYEASTVGNESEKLELKSDPSLPFVGLAFKLDEGRFGQLTYMRIYQGSLARGQNIFNTASNRKIKVPRLVRMHASEMEEINSIGPGEICAMFGVDCHSGTTFTAGEKITLMSMFVPDPVMSLALISKKKQEGNLPAALNRFQKEDPTFRVHFDAASKETIISGMGELHLGVYVERLKREYGLEMETGKPQVAFRETITSRVPFDHLWKKQSGGSGHFARVAGYLEPIEGSFKNEFVNNIIGATVIPPNYIPSIEKAFNESMARGPMIDKPVVGVRMVLNDGSYHEVDSSDIAFRVCTLYAFRQAFLNAFPIILEPIMTAEIMCPRENQASIVSSLTKRKAVVTSTSSVADAVIINVEVPLNQMFNFSTELRSNTQGKGEFSMEYKTHEPVSPDSQQVLIDEVKDRQRTIDEGI